MPTGFELRGMDQLQHALAALSGVPAQLHEQLLEVAENIRDDARRRGPVVSGALRDSITVNDEGDRITVTAGGGATGVVYAPQIHNRARGRGAKGRRFLRLAGLKGAREWRKTSPLARAMHERKRAARKKFAKAGGFRKRR